MDEVWVAKHEQRREGLTRAESTKTGDRQGQVERGKERMKIWS